MAPPGQPGTPLPGPAEKGIAAHPAQRVVGALRVGILIGRLLGGTAEQKVDHLLRDLQVLRKTNLLIAKI